MEPDFPGCPDTSKYLVTLADVKDPETSWVRFVVSIAHRLAFTCEQPQVKITTITMISKFSTTFDVNVLKNRLKDVGPVGISSCPQVRFVSASPPLHQFTLVRFQTHGLVEKEIFFRKKVDKVSKKKVRTASPAPVSYAKLRLRRLTL